MQLKKKNNLIENIVMAYTKKEIDPWMELDGIKYRKDQPEIPANHMYVAPKNTAVPLTESAVHITCPLRQRNVIKNVLNLIRKQLPEHSIGLIVLKMLNG